MAVRKATVTCRGITLSDPVVNDMYDQQTISINTTDDYDEGIYDDIKSA